MSEDKKSVQEESDGKTSSPEVSPAQPLSIGEKRVRVNFNPDNNDVVHQLKQKAAELINMVEEIKHQDPRLASLAQTAFEDGAMWAVKCATA